MSVATKKAPKKKAAAPSRASRIKVVGEPKAKKQKPEMVRVDKVEWEHHKKCQTLAADIDKMQGEFDEQKKAAMEIKAAMSGKQVMLRRMLKTGPERLPLFDGAKPAGTNGHATTAPAGTPAPNLDAWRNVALDTALEAELNKIGTPELKRGVMALMKAKHDTIGKVEDLRAKAIMGDWSSLVKGLSKESMEAVENAVLTWLDKNRDAKVIAEANGKK